MTTNRGESPEPILLGLGAGEARWWGDSLSIIKTSSETTAGRIAVIDNYAVEGAAAPLHIHHNEGELFYVIDGTLTIWAGGKVINATTGSFVYGPSGVPHTFVVTSPTARYLLITEPAGFEQFVREVSAPAEKLALPPPAVRQSPYPDRMISIAAKYGIEILGPPGIPTRRARGDGLAGRTVNESPACCGTQAAPQTLGPVLPSYHRQRPDSIVRAQQQALGPPAHDRIALASCSVIEGRFDLTRSARSRRLDRTGGHRRLPLPPCPDL